MKEPQLYDGNKTKFVEWRDQLHSYLSSHDSHYVELLLWIESLGRNSFRPEDIIALSDDLRLTPTDIIDAKNALYTLLNNFTTGTVKKAFRRRKVRGVFEQYRKVYYAGMRITPTNLFHEKGSVWKVVEATWENVEEAID